MLKRLSAGAVASFLVLVMAGGAYAAEARVPPQNAKKLSEIIAKVEQRQDFQYVGEVDWEDGAYEVTYYTTDHAKVEMKFDPVTGEPKTLR
ncbi:PepSY domain-containing protein [Pseudaminobacter manganicus]|uniref:PepSY domain-containing protein n=1 Tax=Manganibacter manganicus TaxID=1873176 RepID=UPI00111A3D96